MSYAGAGQQTGDTSARGAATYDGHMRRGQLVLPFRADAGEQHLSRISVLKVHGPVYYMGLGATAWPLRSWKTACATMA
jgi:hypothetical protein